ncbi:unnamed protein product [Diplocarpon coronariae]|nr:hypothetical protein JHW43_000086 [Diplocarpon mali]
MAGFIREGYFLVIRENGPAEGQREKAEAIGAAGNTYVGGNCTENNFKGALELECKLCISTQTPRELAMSFREHFRTALLLHRASARILAGMVWGQFAAYSGWKSPKHDAM